MNINTLTEREDPMGAAIRDYFRQGKSAQLKVLSSLFDDDEMPVAHLFRSYHEMPPLEQRALNEARGKVLDVGAGAGCHALALQERGFDVTAVDISPLSCETMKERGVANVECVNIFNQRFQERFDTLLLLMNGTGIAGKLSRLPQLLSRLKQLMNPGAQILIDSSDLRYVYEDEDGVLDVDFDGAYYGEVDYQMTYRNIIGKSFDWLYADSVVLAECCRQCGLKCEILAQGQHYDYLARIVQM
mgnify:FL=1